MTKYLLAAEADQIQDLIFRASHLREVVGGSQLLMRFGDDEAKNSQSALRLLLAQYTNTPDEAIVRAGGGSFRILFDNRKQAENFGQQLAEVYRLKTGGTLSVAEPVLYDGDYIEADKAANKALRKAKRTGSQGQTTAHLPYIAFCASCGVALADRHRKRHPQEESAQFLCKNCNVKAEAQKAERRRREQDDYPGEFLEKFYRVVVPEESYRWPGQADDRDPTQDLAQFDARNYVAYMKADGNNMGRIFGHCDEGDTRSLSQQLTNILRKCLAKPLIALQGHYQDEPKLKNNFIPALPLILGGDDLFVLLPAPWALDIARHFCIAYDQSSELTSYANEFSLPRPTIAAAVVVCKANYPYYLAHAVCERRLKAAKKVAKKLALRQGQHCSVVNFEIITGSQLSEIEETEAEVFDTLRPYWIGEEVPSRWGLPLDTLISCRVTLNDLPRRRRAQLRDYFDQTRGKDYQEAEKTKPFLEQIKARIARNEAHAEKLSRVLGKLGNPTDEWLTTIDRASVRPWYGHGLPDLLDAWDYLLAVDNPLQLGEED